MSLDKTPEKKKETVTLMRKGLLDFLESSNSIHAGLLLQKSLHKIEGTDETKKIKEKGELTAKQALIQKIAAVQPTPLYLLAFKRWLAITHGTENFATVAAHIDGRLFSGLPLRGALETGATIQHTYGMPMLAGSSVKGAVRSYAEHLFCKKTADGDIDFVVTIKGSETTYKMQFDSDKQAVLDVLFGTADDETGDNHEGNQGSTNNAGYLIWHDALWIPHIDNKNGHLEQGARNKPFAGEVVTVHHQEYYNGKLAEALDIENPVPTQQVAVEGDFYFVIEGEQAWADYAKKLLEATLKQAGMGSKTAAGYGYFVTESKAMQLYLANLEEMQRAKKQAKQEAEKLKVLVEAIKNASPILAELRTEVIQNRWKEASGKQSFTDTINNWLDKLEQQPEEGQAIIEFFDIAQIHYADQIKRPNKAKPNQQKWLERLIKLKS